MSLQSQVESSLISVILSSLEMTGERIDRDIDVAVYEEGREKEGRGGRERNVSTDIAAGQQVSRRSWAPGANNSHAHKSPLDPAQLLNRILRRFAQVVRDGQARVRRQDNVDFAYEALARMVQRQVLDGGHKGREASQEVRDALVFVWRGAATRQFADVVEQGRDPFDDDFKEAGA